MGDFERTFGAGANLDSIISGFDRSYREDQRRWNREARQPRVARFGTFQEALAWAKINPGRSFTRSPDGNGFIESGNKNSFAATSIKPGDIEVVESSSAYSTSQEILRIISEPNSTMEAVKKYLSRLCGINGVTEIVGPLYIPTPISAVSDSIIKAGWRLYPLSESICLLDSVYLQDEGGSIDGALITENGETKLLAGDGLCRKMADALELRG